MAYGQQGRAYFLTGQTSVGYHTFVLPFVAIDYAPSARYYEIVRRRYSSSTVTEAVTTSYAS